MINALKEINETLKGILKALNSLRARLEGKEQQKKPQ